MRTGIISRLVSDGLYGEITANSGENIHFHRHCLWDVRFDELAEGQLVDFEVQPSYKGFLGFHIRPHVTNAPDENGRMTDNMLKGTVKEYDQDRGCGTIIDTESGRVLTVYANDIDLPERKTLAQGQEVEFEKGGSQQKNWAVHVRLARISC